ncbi:MAG: PepSY domain-containing protein [Pseudonocardiaceae bacterium]
MNRPTRMWIIGAGVVAVAVILVVAATRGDSHSARPRTGPLRLYPESEAEGDAAETQALQRLVNVSRGDAEAAALKLVGDGTVKKSELETEDDFVIWEVEVIAGDGISRKVTLDAGDGRVREIRMDD